MADPQQVETLKRQIIAALNLQDKTPDQIDAAAPLFREGLGLDSIDALELVVMLERNYGIQIADMEVGRKAFASINALAEFVGETRKSCPKSS